MPMKLEYLFWNPVKKSGVRYDFAWTTNKTIKEVFFKPYESHEVFEYSLYHTFRSPLLLGLMYVLPSLFIGLAIAGLFVAIGMTIITGTPFAKTLATIAKNVGELLLEAIVLLPAILIMATRGLATLFSGVFSSKESEPLENLGFVPPPKL